MKITDTHSHLYLEEFDADRDAVVERAQANGVNRIIMPAINVQTMDRLHAMCDAYPSYCYPLVGLHPTEVGADYRRDLDALKTLLDSSERYVGIGEVGLDFYWDSTYKNEQLDAFCQQIEWSIAYNLPLVIHARSAHKELMDSLYKYKDEKLRGIFHCFSGTPEERDELLQFTGFMLGIGGVLTYKKSTLSTVLADVSLSRIVVETDSPYLAPVPHRGKRNESAYILDTVYRLAACKGLTVEEVAQITTKNAENLFF